MHNTLVDSLVISKSIAAKVGVEAAVLYSTLFDICRYSETGTAVLNQQNHKQLLPFFNASLIQQLALKLKSAGLIRLESAPFDESGELIARIATSEAGMVTMPTTASNSPQRSGLSSISSSWRPNSATLAQLRAMGVNDGFIDSQIMRFISYWQERGISARAWGPKFVTWVTSEHKKVIHQPSPSQTPAGSSNGWQPDPDALVILSRAGIEQSFAESLIPEFSLYWREKGVPQNTWSSLFISYVKRKHHEAKLGHYNLPQPIPKHWQPDENAYEILAMAEIPRAFAQSEVANFVLFWSDSGKPQRSWNTRFVEHVKYKWQHQQSSPQVTQQHNGDTRSSSIVDTLTDTSWAEGLELKNQL